MNRMPLNYVLIRWSLVGLAALLAVIVLFVYAPSLSNEFVNWDDGKLIYNNETVKNFSWESIKTAWTTFDPELYIPLTRFSYQVEYFIFAHNPFYFHLTDLLLHIINTILVFWLLLVLTGKRSISFFVALLFGIHTLNVEAVAWASARKAVLSSFFFLLSMVSYAMFMMKSRKKKYYIWSLLAFFLGLLSKVSIVVLPVLLLLIEYWKQGEIRRRDVLIKWPFFLIATIFGCIAIVGKTQNILWLSTWDVFLLACRSTVFYFEKLVAPLHLSAFYHEHAAITLSSATYFVPLLILIFLLIGVVFSLRWTRLISFCSLWFMILLVPSFSTFIKGGEVFFASDRYVYLAAIGFFLLVVSAVYAAVQRMQIKHASHIAMGVLCAVSLWFASLTHTQSLVWKDTMTLFESAVESRPDVFFSQHNLGWMYFVEGDMDRAIAHLHNAIEIDPTNARAHSNLGFIYGEKGMYEEALHHALKALELDPEKKDAFEEAERMVREAKKD